MAEDMTPDCERKVASDSSCDSGRSSPEPAEQATVNDVGQYCRRGLAGTEIGAVNFDVWLMPGRGKRRRLRLHVVLQRSPILQAAPHAFWLFARAESGGVTAHLPRTFRGRLTLRTRDEAMVTLAPDLLAVLSSRSTPAGSKQSGEFDDDRADGILMPAAGSSAPSAEEPGFVQHCFVGPFEGANEWLIDEAVLECPNGPLVVDYVGEDGSLSAPLPASVYEGRGLFLAVVAQVLNRFMSLMWYTMRQVDG